MNGLKISFAVVAFVLVQGIGVIWYVSKLDSRVDQMYKSFEEENKKEVIENQVKMKLDLENLIADVNQLTKDMKKMQSKDKEIVKQKNIFFNESSKLKNKRGNKEKIKDPILPEIVLFGLILISFFPPIILPKIYPPISEPAHKDNINIKKIAS